MLLNLSAITLFELHAEHSDQRVLFNPTDLCLKLQAGLQGRLDLDQAPVPRFATDPGRYSQAHAIGAQFDYIGIQQSRMSHQTHRCLAE